jgi:hypothetical protein
MRGRTHRYQLRGFHRVARSSLVRWIAQRCCAGDYAISDSVVRRAALKFGEEGLAVGDSAGEFGSVA